MKVKVYYSVSLIKEANMLLQLVVKLVFKIDAIQHLHRCDRCYGILANNAKWNQVVQWALKSCNYLETIDYN